MDGDPRLALEISRWSGKALPVLAKEFELDLEGYGAGFEGRSAGR